MNSIMTETYPLFEHYQALRNQLMVLLDNGDLSFRLGGENPPLGTLCREIGEIQVSYIQSFKAFSQDFSYQHDDPDITHSVKELNGWYQELDETLKETVAGLSEEEIQNRTIDRGGGFEISPRIQLEIYKEALLIFYGKVSVYLKAMEKELPQQWQEWIG